MRHLLPLIFLVLSLLLLACDSGPKHLEAKQYLKDRVINFQRVYTVGYESLAKAQSGPFHPCDKDAPEDVRKPYLRILTNMAEGFLNYQQKINGKLTAEQKTDPLIQKVMNEVQTLAKPFADAALVRQCGSLGKAEALQTFTLPTPEAFKLAASRLDIELKAAQ